MLLVERVGDKNQACHQNLSVNKIIISPAGETYRIESPLQNYSLAQTQHSNILLVCIECNLFTEVNPQKYVSLSSHLDLQPCQCHQHSSNIQGGKKVNCNLINRVKAKLRG